MTLVYILLGLLVLAALYVVMTYNTLVKLRVRVSSAWSDIEVQMKRRYNLVPNLVETVKGYARHEAGTFEAVTRARNEAVANRGAPHEQAATENQLTGALRSLFALAENYPELKANTNFLDLQQQLAEIENNIQAARRYYNASVRDNNTKVDQFPSNMVAQKFGFTRSEFSSSTTRTARRANPSRSNSTEAAASFGTTTMKASLFSRSGVGTAFRALLVALLVTVVAAPAIAAGRERILNFDSEIWIHRDGSMHVRETIEVESAGEQIRHGIYRDFPTVYNSHGRRVVVPFDIEEVTRDGRKEPYHTQPQGNGVRVYFGDKNVYIHPGRHTYTLTYRTDRQLGYFGAVDELYWNVTGNGWRFPIERARAIVHLPEGARVRDHAGYTGREGERGQDYTYEPMNDGIVRFTTTRTLQPGEGLTIAVAWPAGFVERPTGARKTMYFIEDNAVAIAGGIGLGLLLFYYLYVWLKVGRDPEKGAIVPQYEPPASVTPAGARYVMQFGFDDKAFTAAVVNMAVKGFLTITRIRTRSTR